MLVNAGGVPRESDVGLESVAECAQKGGWEDRKWLWRRTKTIDRLTKIRQLIDFVHRKFRSGSVGM